jgi:hypothetical protein
MVIRAKYHWLMLFNTAIFFAVGAFALIAGGMKGDPFYTTFIGRSGSPWLRYQPSVGRRFIPRSRAEF